MQIIWKDFIDQLAQREASNKTEWSNGKSSQAADYIYIVASVKYTIRIVYIAFLVCVN